MGRNFTLTNKITTRRHKKKGFTLAEVLITLGIIGVVAAVTLPTLVSNHQKKVLVNQLKQSYSLLNQTFRSAMATDGVDDFRDTQLVKVWPGCGTTNFCTNSDFKELINELNKFVKVYAEGEYTLRSPKTPAISFPNGFHITVGFLPRGNDNIERCNRIKELGGAICEKAGSVEIDVNGNKKPNIEGRDIFDFTIGPNGFLYPSGGKDTALIYAPTPNLNQANWQHGSSFYPCMYAERCEYSECTYALRGEGCAARIMEEGWQMNY